MDQVNQAEQAEKALQERAKNRADFMRRLFAIAISVGVGFALSRMKWVEFGTLPNPSDWEKIVVLGTVILATVLSWDGYLLSIETKKLIGDLRFIIDIALVFIYMLMLMTALHLVFWLPLMCVVFALYIAWDLLTIREYHHLYYLKEGAANKTSFLGAIKVYLGSIFGGPEYSRGPAITFYWGAYILVLTLLVRHYPTYNVYVACLLGIVGLQFYRFDKLARGRKYDRGYTMIQRITIIGVLLSFGSVFPWVSDLEPRTLWSVVKSACDAL